MVRGVGPGARGMALVPPGTSLDGQPAGMRLCFADHPVPSAEGISVSRDALARVEALGQSARLLYLVSGGASALFEVPRDSISEDDLIETYAALVTSGLPIERINIVRRALSAVKGGRLASAAYPAAVTTLAVSDVEGDLPEAIGSGPTVASDDPEGLALEIVRDSGLEGALPAPVVAELQRPSMGAAGPTRIDGYEIVASLGHAEDGAVEWLEGVGYRCIAPPLSRLNGEATDAAWSLVEAATAAIESGRKTAIVVGGETTVKVPANAGTGGRNGHFAAVLAAALYKNDGFACMVGGTDGIDGNCGAAGALIDGESARRAAVAGYDLRDALEKFDTGGAFAASGDAVVTGPTGTNVGDLLVAVFDAA